MKVEDIKEINKAKLKALGYKTHRDIVKDEKDPFSGEQLQKPEKLHYYFLYNSTFNKGEFKVCENLDIESVQDLKPEPEQRLEPESAQIPGDSDRKFY